MSDSRGDEEVVEIGEMHEDRSQRHTRVLGYAMRRGPQIAGFNQVEKSIRYRRARSLLARGAPVRDSWAGAITIFFAL